ncbi:TIGR04211 family SH3 domain-containing protein [Pleionea sp. CnH1-48]|uniref:TIGR04211 family SH3 domain-containing protein n=1 Tax=Pleionea sp. CnH1-48 TaxID=2954494 RepID=UPI00209834DF|nr:TIGR04211 family SH3 domain-containing protein [Pleionea sp. CnH1-48]MCO7225652.1 TIGR04211 family SH3 domain-containing protein [Pleionea sp. CnH1-48]
MSTLVKFILFTAVAFISAAQANQVAYVTNDLKIHVRSGPTDGYRIKYFLLAGDAVTLNGEAENGYQPILDARGRDGWLEAKYVSPIKGAKIALSEANQEIQRLKSSHKAQVTELENRIANLSSLAKKAATSQQTISKLQTELNSVKQQNDLISGRFKQETFFAGAVVVLVGVILGIVFGRATRKKNTGWS